MKDSFSNRHPLVPFAFFSAAILLTMFQMQPVCLGISFLCALLNAWYLGGKKTVWFTVKFVFPMMLLVAAVNPLFNHRGATVLWYLPWDNPLTLESLFFGAASAVLIGAVALWFSAVNKVITSDKVVYLFGRIAPALSLVLAIALRFLPRFIAQFKLVKAAQSQLFSQKRKAPLQHIQDSLRVFSVMVNWSMENAIDTADSMKSRGYGLKGRTAFSPFRFRRRDAVLLTAVLLLTASAVALAFFGGVSFRYFPSVKGNIADGFAVLYYSVNAALLLTPLLINIGEGIQWKRLQSGI